MKQKLIPVLYRIEEIHKKKIKEIAKEKNLGESEVVRKLIDELIKNQKIEK